MATSFIGMSISLTTHSDVLYKGTLVGIDPTKSTIRLSRVYSMGTQSRRPPTEFIPPVPTPYEYIIFRASEVKDLAVHDQSPGNVYNDPAVVHMSGDNHQPASSFQHPSGSQDQAQAAPHATDQPPSQSSSTGQASNVPARTNGSVGSPSGAAGRTDSITDSMVAIERAISDLRENGTNPQHRGGRRGGGNRPANHAPAADIKAKGEFDFAASNARFDKLAEPQSETASPDGDPEDKKEPAYDPKKSFFDALTPSSNARGGGARGRGRGSNRRQEERDKNVVTFGETGDDVPSMGHTAYRRGGYGRRGGGRGRRGGAVGTVRS